MLNTSFLVALPTVKSQKNAIVFNKVLNKNINYEPIWLHKIFHVNH